MHNVITQLETGKECRDFHLKGDVLIKGKDGCERVALTEVLAKLVIHEINELYGHIGTCKCRKIF